ncbi:hypothetical protein B484DRAFT_449227 [Ochromonadaceae sp. CCMP2298]|nr:hypothetical protein B484DRAFT_449227 [Ochromonadaceae sp. CCMP2298]|mmetsp:Transcript_25785/g.57099  ORF Transcript_25785/g.57099 Transcript_25785/m.57099 type:complete len:471 (-) Transcript_25785:139-1551(-)|eukprot:CAMPEP_0173200424 /NCGR_PEP_ID=MMETSP1141-20130122/17782_1 /TAXON_ID=483371 /ORGANISM="non described non described, Strain CCMP2298" /LENGTH=470 /DNA_ID=CAMNT_0014125421 /DNA_START=49 /DNA_END=1461 /DNA_ORIENTATION=+
MASRGFSYNKWDNIELSDDESDLHPNIDKDSWFRMKHRSRLEREEKEDKEVQEFIQHNAGDQSRLNIINARLKGIQCGEADDDAEFEDVDALQVEANELQARIAGRSKIMEDIKERRSWNIDNICKVKEEKTVVNKTDSKALTADVSTLDPAMLAELGMTPDEIAPVSAAAASKAKAASASAAKAVPAAPTPAGAATPPPPPAPVPTSSSISAALASVPARGSEPAAAVRRERLQVVSYNEYAHEHERLLETYSDLQDIEATKDFLFKHCDVLLHEHAQNYMLLSCLEDEMNGKKTRMKLVCRQSQILSHIHELGTSMKRDPRDVILPFFVRLGEKGHLEGFLSAVADFTQRIQKRSVEKRKEMDREKALAARQEAIDNGAAPLGPGGLDPMEVLESLPEALREAFESQDVARLQKVLGEMGPREAKDCMKRCVDSGLWVAKDESIFENDDEMGDEDEEEDEGDAADAKA